MANEPGRKGMESRMRLLEVAANEFATHGFHETKISTIVKKAGLTQPSFYLYFASKEAIFDELASEFHARVKDLMASVRLEEDVRHGDLSARLTETVETVFRFLIRDPSLTCIGFRLHPKAEQLKEEIAIALKENLEAEQKLGYFRPELEMGMVAECLRTVIEHFTFAYLLPGSKDARGLAIELVDFFMHGMAANRAHAESGENH